MYKTGRDSEACLGLQLLGAGVAESSACPLAGAWHALQAVPKQSQQQRPLRRPLARGPAVLLLPAHAQQSAFSVPATTINKMPITSSSRVRAYVHRVLCFGSQLVPETLTNIQVGDSCIEVCIAVVADMCN